MEHLPGRLELKCASSTAIQTVEEYLSSSSIFWYYDYYQEEEKGQLISNLIFLCEEFKIYVVFINTVFPSGSGG